MKRLKNLAIVASSAALASCASGGANYDSTTQFPPRTDDLVEMTYRPEGTAFELWSPEAEAVYLLIYNDDVTDRVVECIDMKREKRGTWTARVQEDLLGRFYTFNVKVGGEWLGETPGINARAVGVNGRRAAVVDMAQTNPANWNEDVSPALASTADAIIYEMHHRDFSVDPDMGPVPDALRGKYLALTTDAALLHLKDLGVTHVHILPSFDYASVDESRTDSAQYNWGYDPLNYNVPEGSYATDTADPRVRIMEFKQMVQALHAAGLRVVLDVVYNHTFDIEGSNFQRTAPGYFFRTRSDGSYANASGCGNETASERPMMRKYIIESVRYWMREYHIDGFRFDLMGIHDIETMNAVADVAREIDPQVLIYGEGWAAEAPQLPENQLAMKANVKHLPGIAAFSDEMRDALRGPFSNDHESAFLNAKSGHEHSIRFGVVGAVEHPDVDYSQVNYATEPWAREPQQMISYVSCHDDMCLVDRLKSSIEGIDVDELIRLDKLAQTAVFTSQGIPFMQAGEELLRDKKGVHNSYVSPDSVNAIAWRNKVHYADVWEYYRALISLRKNHKAFHMGSAEAVRKNLSFIGTPDGVVAYKLNAKAVGDTWDEIVVVLNAQKNEVEVALPTSDTYNIVCRDGRIDERSLGLAKGGRVKVGAQSAMILRK